MSYMVTCLLCQLVCHRCTGDLALVDMLINNLLGWLVDTSSVVRKLCIRGLGNIASLGPQLVSSMPWSHQSLSLLSQSQSVIHLSQSCQSVIHLSVSPGIPLLFSQSHQSHSLSHCSLSLLSLSLSLSHLHHSFTSLSSTSQSHRSLIQCPSSLYHPPLTVSPFYLIHFPQIHHPLLVSPVSLLSTS